MSNNWVMVRKLCRRDFLKLTASGALGLALNELGILPLGVEDYKSFDVEIADLSLPVPWRTSDFEDELGVICNEIQLRTLENNPYFPYKIVYEGSRIEKARQEKSVNNIPTSKEIPKEILNASPFERIIVDDVKELRDLRGFQNGPELLENIIYNCPPCCKGDVDPGLIDDGSLGSRAQELFRRVKESAVAFANLDELILQYDILLSNQPNHPEKERITAKRTELADKKASCYRDFYSLPLLELQGRTSCRNLIASPEVHPESTHYHPQLDVAESPTHCYGWVMRIVDILSQIKDDSDISPVTSDNNGNYMMKNGIEKISFEQIFDWFKSEAVLSGWNEETDYSYDRLIEEADDKIFVCFGVVGQDESTLLDDEKSDHVFIARKLRIDGATEPVMVVAELVNHIPNGAMFAPVDPNNPFKLMGNQNFIVKKYSLKL